MTTKFENTDPYVEREQRANELGWTYVSDARCPRRLVGKHCTDVDCWCGTISSGDTVGARMHFLNDHGATWRNKDGIRFVLWEPYGAEGELLTELLVLCRRDGLRVDICPSVWFPPYTVGIRFRAVAEKSTDAMTNPPNPKGNVE